MILISKRELSSTINSVLAKHLFVQWDCDYVSSAKRFPSVNNAALYPRWLSTPRWAGQGTLPQHRSENNLRVSDWVASDLVNGTGAWLLHWALVQPDRKEQRSCSMCALRCTTRTSGQNHSPSSGLSRPICGFAHTIKGLSLRPGFIALSLFAQALISQFW